MTKGFMGDTSGEYVDDDIGEEVCVRENVRHCSEEEMEIS
jgi:hypothetical protein